MGGTGRRASRDGVGWGFLEGGRRWACEGEGDILVLEWEMETEEAEGEEVDWGGGGSKGVLVEKSD